MTPRHIIARLPIAPLLMAPGLALCVLAAGPGAALAAASRQPQANPVYVDDSPTARETFLGIDSQLVSGNFESAVRVLQRLLDEEGDRVVAGGGDPDLFISVRARANQLIASTPQLLARYRQVEGPKAQRALEEGQVERVERNWLLTAAGKEAVLRLAQGHLEGARFEAAWLTLRQLEHHPDRRGALGADAAELLAKVARYIDRGEVWDAANRWATESAAAAPQRDARNWPALAARRGQSPMESTGPVKLDGLVAKALWTVPVGPPSSPLRPEPAMSGGEPLPLFARDLRVLPTVAGETVYVNDGTTVSAWDRFTLTRRWSFGDGGPRSEAEERAAQQRLINRRFRQNFADEPSTVSVRGRTVAAITNAQDEGRREGQMRLHVLDAETGHRRWARVVTDEDDQLDGSSLRATPMLCDGVVIVAARKSNLSRRLSSLYLVALSEADGSPVWRRLVGSAGSLPFGGRGHMLDAGVLHAGVVYIGDQLGVLGAYEAHSGRPVWVRRIDTQTWTGGESSRPWEVNAPIIDGDTLLTLTPDRNEVVRISLADGAILAQRGAERLGAASPRYLVRVADKLAVVGEHRIGLVPLAEFDTAESLSSPRFREPGIRGRVVGAGGTLLVPTATGVAALDAATPTRSPVEIPLESPGNILALPSQLLVVDDGRMHSYLLWEAAEAVLTERMQEDPSNPVPAVTFAELAYRASRPERILPAVRAAIDAIERTPRPGGDESARRRLFASVLEMVNTSQEPPGPLGGRTAMPEVKLADPRLIADLIAELGRLSLDADERASHLLALGRSHEAQGGDAGAVETYQSILDEPALAAATWSGPQVSLRAELEATWRLQRLISEAGPGIYAPYEAAAEGELAALGPTPSAARLERIARRYPVAAVTPSIWRQIADLHEARGRTQAIIPALEAGLRAAGWRDDLDLGLIGDLAGRLARSLAAQGQTASAAQVLRTLTERYPNLAFEGEAGPIAATVLLGQYETELASRHRWPRVGPVRARGVQVIRNATMLRQRVTSTTGRVGRAIATSDGDEVAVWMAMPGDGTAVGGSGEFVKRWARPIPGRGVDLVKIEDDDVYLFYDTRHGGILEKVSAGRGTSTWQTQPFPEMFPREGPPGIRRDDPPQPVQTPRDGMGLLTDLFMAMDDRTVTLVERTGRAVALDAADGSVLWAQRLPVGPVFDTDVRGGTLLVAGDQEVPGGAGYAPVILSLDARTGKVVQRIESRWGQVRWLRSLEGGAVIAGMEDAIVSFDVERGQTNWVLDDRRAAASREAWVVRDRLFLHGAGGAMWVVATQTGRLGPQPVRLPPEFQDEYQRLLASHVPGGRPGGAIVAFSTLAGVILVNADGEIVGMDAVPDGEAVLPPLAAESMMVTIETSPAAQQSDGQMVFNLHMLDTATGRLKETRGIILGARPSRMMLMDGVIAISAGSATLIIPAPPSP